jgi:DNA-3-methyladenine glycosylase I
MERCRWKNLDKYHNYIQYHDNEWGVPSHDELYLFEMIVLEAFHSGLSWVIILNKREDFREAFDNFNPMIIKEYDEDKIDALLNNKKIVRHEGKIRAAINNASCFLKIQEEFGAFSDYIWSFTNYEILYSENDELITTNKLSDEVAKDMKKRGFKYMGSITTYSYLEAIGIMNNHSSFCFRYKVN